MIVAGGHRLSLQLCHKSRAVWVAKVGRFLDIVNLCPLAKHACGGTAGYLLGPLYSFVISTGGHLFWNSYIAREHS